MSYSRPFTLVSICQLPSAGRYRGHIENINQALTRGEPLLFLQISPQFITFIQLQIPTFTVIMTSTSTIFHTLPCCIGHKELKLPEC